MPGHCPSTFRRPLALLLPALLAASLTGCVRTYDGSIMPAYQTTVVYAGPVPLLGMKRTPTGPGNAGYEFPSAPPRPAQVQSSSPRSAVVRRTVRAQAPAASAAERHAVRCRDAVSAGGRVRVDCE